MSLPTEECFPPTVPTGAAVELRTTTSFPRRMGLCVKCKTKKWTDLQMLLTHILFTMEQSKHIKLLFFNL